MSPLSSPPAAAASLRRLLPRYEVRGKLSRLNDEFSEQTGKVTGQAWSEMCLGSLQVLYGKDGDEATRGRRYLVMRDEKLGKLKLNCLVAPSMKFSQAGKCNVRFAGVLEEAEATICPNEDGVFRRVLNHEKVVQKSVVLNLKVPQAKIDETMEQLNATLAK